jgi:two-component sensor histidine kinase/Tfp pilus assembly protein PilF
LRSYIAFLFLVLSQWVGAQIDFVDLYQRYEPEKYREFADVCDSTILNSAPDSKIKEQAKALRFLIIHESDARNAIIRLRTILERQNEDSSDSSIISLQASAAELLIEAGKYEKANLLYNDIFRILPTEDNVLIADYLRKQGNLYRRMGKTKLAIENYYAAIKKLDAAKEDDKKLRGFIHLSLGILHKNQQDYSTALEEYRISERLFKELEDENGLAQTYNNMGIVYKWLKNYNQAEKEYKKCLGLWSKLEDFKNMAKTYHNLGVLNVERGDFDEAIHYAKKSIDIRLQNSLRIGLFTNYYLVAKAYLNLGNKQEFKKYLKLTEEEFRQHNTPGNQYALLTLSIANDTIAGNYKGAFEKISFKNKLRDSLYNSEILDYLKNERNKYDNNLEIEVNENKLELKRAKEDLRSERRREEVLIRWGGGVLLFLALAFLVLLFFRFRETKRSKVQLEKANEELKETLISKEEKEVLLQEIHHRVKNNLQIIMSLLRLQKHHIQDERVLELYAESENRIRSMALVHEELYGNKDFAKVNVKDYLDKLLNNLIQNYSIENQVKSDIKIEVEQLNIDTLIPLGLLCNELISNALKHGLKKTQHPEISIHIKNDINYPKVFTLDFSDNGIGVESKSDLEKEDSIGMDLILSLVDQLDGKFELDTESQGLAYHFQLTRQN